MLYRFAVTRWSVTSSSFGSYGRMLSSTPKKPTSTGSKGPPRPLVIFGVTVLFLQYIIGLSYTSAKRYVMSDDTRQSMDKWIGADKMEAIKNFYVRLGVLDEPELLKKKAELAENKSSKSTNPDQKEQNK
jgi:hypothetical protein